MPYIKHEDRERLKPILDVAFMAGIRNVGEFNYVLSSICQIFEHEMGESYNTHNSIVGALECVKTEWSRKKLGPYEDKKELENGTIWS